MPVPDAILLGALDGAAATADRLAREGKSTLGDLARIGIGERDYPVGGISLRPLRGNSCDARWCEETQRAFSLPTLAGDLRPQRVDSGSRALRLIVLSDPVRAWSAHNFGQSDDPASPHIDDQARLLTSPRRLKPVYFERSQLDGHIHSERRLTWEPAK